MLTLPRDGLTADSHSRYPVLGERIPVFLQNWDAPYAISSSTDNTLKVWNLKTAQELLTITGNSNGANDVVMTPDGKYLVSHTSYDNTLHVWELETQDVIASFCGESTLTCCAVAPDGLTIVAGEASGRVHFLRLEGMETSP
jgi:WD40 repeat protein